MSTFLQCLITGKKEGTEMDSIEKGAYFSITGPLLEATTISDGGEKKSFWSVIWHNLSKDAGGKREKRIVVVANKDLLVLVFLF